VILSEQITSRVLEVAIPSGPAADQVAAINRAIQYGQNVGVKVNITVVVK
jgi:hypothetical protein